jgi:DprA winged helix domain
MEGRSTHRRSEQIKTRISELEEQLKSQHALSDELELLRRALALLDSGSQSRVRAVTARETGPERAPAKNRRAKGKPAAARTPPARAPRGQNRTEILKALEAGPMTASDVSRKTGMNRGSASTMLGIMAMAGEIVKATHGYALPR